MLKLIKIHSAVLELHTRPHTHTHARTHTHTHTYKYTNTQTHTVWGCISSDSDRYCGPLLNSCCTILDYCLRQTLFVIIAVVQSPATIATKTSIAADCNVYLQIYNDKTW